MKKKTYLTIILVSVIFTGVLETGLALSQKINFQTVVLAEKDVKKSKTKKKKTKKKKTPEYKKINNEMKEKRELATVNAGTYIVGQDIQAGEYVVVIGDKDLEGREGFYTGGFSLYSDTNKTEEISSGQINQDRKELAEDGIFSKAKFKKSELTEYSSILIEIKDGQLIELKNTKMYPAELREKQNPNKIVEGYYKVGRDIPEGKYSIENVVLGGEQLHSIWIYNTVDPSVNTKDATIKIYQDYSDETYPDEIVLDKNTYIYFSDLIFKKKK